MVVLRGKTLKDTQMILKGKSGLITYVIYSFIHYTRWAVLFNQWQQSEWVNSHLTLVILTSEDNWFKLMGFPWYLLRVYVLFDSQILTIDNKFTIKRYILLSSLTTCSRIFLVSFVKYFTDSLIKSHSLPTFVGQARAKSSNVCLFYNKKKYHPSLSLH